MKPGYYKDISNEDYHAGPGVSKSMLDMVRKAPALLQWSRTAPRDDETTAVDIGDAFHAFLLEPERFDAEFVAAPEINRRTNLGKSTWANFQHENRDKTVLTDDDFRQLELMRESVYCHPTARKFLEMAGDVEASTYVTDPKTGLLLRSRADKQIHRESVMFDVKTTADMDRFAASLHDFSYYVQDPFYSDIYKLHFGEPLRLFFFLAVSTTRSMGQYPVRCFVLTNAEKAEGRYQYEQDLLKYQQCLKSQIWPGFESIERPGWVKRNL